MKITIYFLFVIAFALTLCTRPIFAQQNLQEVVYLKNGSIIRGAIIEQVPNKSIKIQTGDGSVFVYQMDEVEKITKEAPYKSSYMKEESKITTGSYAGYLL